MDGIASAASALTASGTMGAVNVAMLKKTQDMVQAQMTQLIESIPQSANMPGVGRNADYTG